MTIISMLVAGHLVSSLFSTVVLLPLYYRSNNELFVISCDSDRANLIATMIGGYISVVWLTAIILVKAIFGNGEQGWIYVTFKRVCDSMLDD